MISAKEPFSAGVLRSRRIATGLGRLIFISLLLLIPLVAIPYGTVEPWWQAVFEFAVFSLSALSIIQYLFSGSNRINGYPLLLPVVALALFSLIQSLPLWKVSVGDPPDSVWTAISADPYETRRVFLKLLALMLTGGMLLRFTSSRKRLQALVHVVIAVGLASSVFGLVRQSLQDAPGFFLPYLEGPGSYAQFISKSYFAYLVEMALGLVVGLIVGGGVARNRILLYLTAAVIMWAALIMSHSRGGILALASQVLLLIVLGRGIQVTSKTSLPTWFKKFCRSYIFRVTLILWLLVGLTVSIIWVGGEPLVTDLERAPSDFTQQGSEQHSNSSRRDIWEASWRLFEANPVVGAGFGAYWVAVTRHHEASGEFTPQQAHNDYLELLASGGIVGAGLMTWFIVAFSSAAKSQLHVSDDFRRAACYGALVGLFGVAVHSFVDFGLHATINALIFVVLGVIATVKLSAKRLPKERTG